MPTTPTAPHAASGRRSSPPPLVGEWTAPARLAGVDRITAGALALAVLALALAIAWTAESPPSPLPADAPEGQFSADRAWPHLERIASGGPTPIGSPEITDVRDYLVGELRDLELDPEVQTGVGARAFRSGISAGAADNIVATIPGTDSTGTVLLAAHYDSTTTTPGTSDDKASVAAVLEIARAISAGPAPRNDIAVLLTDGEEPGLVGAEAFATHHPTAADHGFMVNMEGPGNAGPAVIYNISDGNGPVVRMLTGLPHPAGESAVVTGFRDAPLGFNSDRTAMDEHGFAGVDSGPVDGRVYYHHPRDTVERFNRPSMQMHGANALALTRAAAAADLDTLHSGTDSTFFSAYDRLFHYPNTLVWPLAAAGALAVLGLAVLARARLLVSVPRLLLAVGAGALPLVGAAALAIGLWELLLFLRPAYADLATDTYRPVLYRFALGVGLLSLVWCWYVLLRRALGGVALTISALAWTAALGLVLAWLLPSGSYLGAVPAIAGAGAGSAALLLRERRPRLAISVLTVGAVAGAVLLFLPGRTLLSMFGVSMLAPGALFLVLATLAALPLLAVATPGPGSAPRTALGPLICAVLAVALVGAGLSVDRFDEEHPRTAHLTYLLDADTGTAFWASNSRQPHPWAAELVPDTAGPETAALPAPSAPALARTGPANAADLPAPEVEVVSSRPNDDGSSDIDLRIRARSETYEIGVYSAVPVRSATVTAQGHPTQQLPDLDAAEFRSNRDTEAWAWAIEFYAPPEGDLRFTLTVEESQAVRLGVSETWLGLEGLPGFRPRPGDVELMPSTGALPTDTTTVFRTLAL